MHNKFRKPLLGIGILLRPYCCYSAIAAPTLSFVKRIVKIPFLKSSVLRWGGGERTAPHNALQPWPSETPESGCGRAEMGGLV